jgi:hypothetical protein
MLSRSATRGYTIGIPALTFSPARTECDEGSITKLYDEMLDSPRQRVHSFEDPCVMFLATNLSQLSFRSNRPNVRNRLA